VTRNSVKAILRKVSISIGRAHGSWLTLLLLLVVLVPSVCLLWFMNQAVHNERLAVRQRLVDAYRGHLSLAQDRLATYWNKDSEEMEAQTKNIPPPALFAKLIRAGLADAVVCFDRAGKVVYPGALPSPRRQIPGAGWAEAHQLEAGDLAAAAAAYFRLAGQATNTDLAALALQSQARCLLQAGRKVEALSVLTGPLAEQRYQSATDSQGRFLAPNAGLMALELLKDSAHDQMRIVLVRLQKQLVDYEGSAMPAPQRRFLMRELQKLFPREVDFPTLAAEDLAARYVEAGAISFREPAFHPGPLPDIWQFASSRGSVVTLHRTENLLSRMRTAVSSQGLPADVRVDFVPPGQEADGSFLSLPAGPTFPGWRFALSLQDQRLFDAATNERITSYIWIGALSVALVIILALLALGLVRRQVALTQLRNDLVANVTHELKTPLSSMRLLVETLLNSPQLHEPTAREYLQLIAKENMRLSRLIDNFLTFSRIERNKYSFDFEEVPATTLIEGAAAAVRERFNVPGCRFEVQAAPDLPPVLADADAMVTALLNLLDNAYKYSGDAKQITLSACAENGSVFFTVRDNGIGLSARERKRIFKRFYQVNQHSSPTGGGCGLGLSIVQFVVTAHRGTVRVESEPQRGSSFIVTLPATGSRPYPEAKP
jgi:signal transduction histidine kinase